MFGVGAPEALFISLVALLVFGPVRLAEAARECGAMLGRTRRKLDQVKKKLASADYPDEWFEDHDQQQENLLDERVGD